MMGLNWRCAYIVFAITLGTGTGSLFHENVYTAQLGNPNSRQGTDIRRVHFALTTTMMVLSVIGLVLLLFDFSNMLIAMLYTACLLACVCLAIVVIVRIFIWTSYSDELQARDFRNASVDHIARRGKLSRHLIYVQDTYKCCGVKNILEWPTQGMLNIRRRVPDACCVPKFRKRRCGEKALPVAIVMNNSPDCDKKCRAEFGTTKLKVLVNSIIRFDSSTTDTERDNVRAEIDKVGIDPCNMTLQGKYLFLYTPTSTPVPWPVETLCHQLYQSDPSLTYENFLLSYLNESGRFYVNGCQKYLVEYTEKIIYTAGLYTLPLLLLAFAEIAVFYKYYWEFRQSQIVEEVPVWLKKSERLKSRGSIRRGRRTIRHSQDPRAILRDLQRRGILLEDTGNDDENPKRKRQRQDRPSASSNVFPHLDLNRIQNDDALPTEKGEGFGVKVTFSKKP